MLPGMRTAALASVLLVSMSAAADQPPMPTSAAEATETACEATFEERVADARVAVATNDEYMAVHNKYLPWFREHCRFLSELEIAIRKIDDENAFVCDTAKGRPQGLTSEIAVAYGAPSTPHVHQKHHWSNFHCRVHDSLARFPLVLVDSGTSNYVAALLGVKCWGVESDECAKVRESLATWREKFRLSLSPHRQ